MKFSNTEMNPTENKGPSLTIGDITISQFGDGELWIESEERGDSGSFSEKDFEEHIKKFYAERF